MSLEWNEGARPSLTALITSFNEKSRIAACIESVLWCDRILLVDSYSTDGTLEIARGYPKVETLQHEYYGGAAQKNWALQHVSGDWVLILDSDEVCPPALRDEIQALLIEGPRHRAYQMRRRVYFLGERIRFSGWQHDQVARLFARGSARYADRRVHAQLLTDGTAPVLRSHLDHFMVDSLAEFVERITTYSRWGAAQAYREGRRVNVLDLLTRPTYRFLRTYVLQLGFLDGVRGLLFTLIQAAGSFHKTAALLGWQMNEARGLPPADLPAFEDGFEKTVDRPELDRGDAAPLGTGQRAPS